MVKPVFGSSWIFQLAVPGKHAALALHAHLCHSIYNFIWDRGKWGFRLKSLFLFFRDLCSTVTQFHSKCGIYYSSGGRRAFKTGSLCIGNAAEC